MRTATAAAFGPAQGAEVFARFVQGAREEPARPRRGAEREGLTRDDERLGSDYAAGCLTC